MYIVADETHKGENTGFLLLLWVAFNFEIGGHNNHTSISANRTVKYSAEIRHHHLDYSTIQEGGEEEEDEDRGKWDSPLKSKGYYAF